MHVNANIMLLNGDGSVDKVNVYMDGSLSLVGSILYRSYQHEEDTHLLLSLGDISSINERGHFEYDTTHFQTKELVHFNSLSEITPKECNYLYVPSREEYDRWLYCNSDAYKFEDLREEYGMSFRNKFSREYLNLQIAKFKKNHFNCLRHKSSWQSLQSLDHDIGLGNPFQVQVQ